MKKLAAGVALTTLASLMATGALAQSTASQVAEVVVTTSRQNAVGGVAVQSQVAKDQAIITQQYIQSQVGTSNAAQLINMLPGVSYSTEDPTGLLSSDLRIHGFDGAHIAFTLDGTPINDSGNYASYPGEYAPAEITDRITVNSGGAEVDAPTASTLGATVNVVTKLPPTTPGFIGSVAGGSYNFYRGYGEVDTGAIGPWGTRAYFQADYADSNKWKGGGTLQRLGLDGRIYQPLKDNDFISLAYTYVKERSYFYESNSLAQFAQYGRNIDYNTQWVVPTRVTGVADTVPPSAVTAPGQLQGSDSNYWALHPNPVDFAVVRGSSRFDLSHGFTFTFDPSFFYTVANGGGTTSLSEKDVRLIGKNPAKACPGGGSGVDLNGDGDCLDTVLVYSPSNTQTDRFTVLSSLLWDLNQENHFQLSYTFDYANHRQTGLYDTIDQSSGNPSNIFGGLFGPQILSQDGTPLRGRDRYSIAQLNQISLNYIGRFIDDKLHVNVGVRDPYFTRNINQYCYTYNGSSAYCDSGVDPVAAQAAYAAGVAAHNATALNALFGGGITINYNTATGAPNFKAPYSQTYHFNKILPNAGATYAIDGTNHLYVSYSQGFAAPKTDDLYVSGPILVQPETTDNFAGGYRFTSPTLTAEASLWGAIWHNHIVQSIDPNDPTLSLDRNVGTVNLYGLDFQAGWHPIQPLSFFFSATLEKTALQSNYYVTASAGPDKGLSIPLPVKGKELVLTPDQIFAFRPEYKAGPFRIGADIKYTGRRWVDDVNSVSIPGFTTINMDASWQLPGQFHNATLSINAVNVTNANYYVRLSTVGAASAVAVGPDTVNASSTFYYNSPPATVYGKLALKF